jgi:hypothetical protein
LHLVANPTWLTPLLFAAAAAAALRLLLLLLLLLACRYFKEINRPIDFYLVANPTWLDSKFPQQAKQVKRPCMALVSTDEQWMT